MRRQRTSRPLGDLERLELFIDLVAEYFALAGAMPVGDEDAFIFDEENAPDYWHRIVRVMALRKFMMLKNDHVYVGRVLQALRRSLSAETPGDVTVDLRERFKAVALSMRLDDGTGAPVTFPQVLDDLINGSLLHSDPDRWERVRARGHGSAHSLPLWMFTKDSERLLRRIVRVIELGRAEGYLPNA